MRLLFITLCTVALIHAQTTYIDTIRITSDTAGPIQIPDYFYSELQVLSDSATPLPAWRHYSQTNQLRFEHPVKAGTPLYLHYSTKYGKLKRRYYRYTPGDSMAVQREMKQTGIMVKEKGDNSITFTGEKGITFSTGSSGGTSVEQTLDVSLSGKISEEITISGHISDQSTSLQGDSKEVGELDRIYLTVEGKKWDATVGDIKKREMNGSLLEESKAPKGGRFAFHTEKLHTEIYGGISGSKQASQTFIGVSGIQSGMYTLTGEGTEGSVYIVNNSVKITVDGEKLTEGEEEGDFYVDYENSAIVFTNRFPIENGQRIEVQYLYKNSEYEKFTIGGTYEQNFGDSVLRISGGIALTGDNFESNERGYRKEDLEILKNAGDRAPFITSGKKVHHKDILKEATRYRLYKKDTLANRYEWESQPATVGEAYPLYIVQFRKEESREGEYLPYSTDEREQFTMHSDSLLDLLDTLTKGSFLEPIYLYVGAPLGTHTPKQQAILPEQLTLGELMVHFNPSERLSLYTGIIGKHQDLNTQSERDDHNNSSGYVENSLKLSTDVNKMLVTSLTSDFVNAPGSISERKKGRYDMERSWGLTSDTSQYLFWRERLTSRFKEKLSHTVSVGQLYVDKKSFSDVVDNRLSFSTGKLSQEYNILLRRQHDIKKEGYRQSYRNSLNLKALEYTALVENEWFDHELFSQGYVKGEVSLFIPKLQWRHEFKRRHDRRGTASIIDAKDTAITTLWTQKFDKNLSKHHHLRLNSTVQKVEGQGGESLLLLYGIRDNIKHHERDMASQLSLSTTMESALQRVWEFLPVPKGTGTHIKDPLTGTYIESGYGDYIAKEVILFGDASRKTVRNRMDWNWHIKSRSRNRASDGLRFSGILRLSEDIEPEKKGISQAWIPAYTSINEKSKDSLLYSAISYSQKISWLPPQKEKLFVQSEAEISRKLSNSSLIRFIRGKNEFSKGFEKWQFGVETPWFLESRGIFEYETILREFLLEPSQSLRFHKRFSTALTETIGRISVDQTGGTLAALKPALSFHSDDNRISTFSYSAGYVDLSRDPIYPMAKEFRRGLNHRLALNLNVKLGKMTTMTGFLRADYHKDSEWQTSMSLNALVKIK